MLNFLQQATTITNEITVILRSYQCGVQGKVIKVCCPENPITIQIADKNNGVATTPPTKPTTSVASDVTNHKNIHLLPPVSDCGILSSNNRITNGNKTVLFEFPWMALLSYKTSKQYIQFKLSVKLILAVFQKPDQIFDVEELLLMRDIF